MLARLSSPTLGNALLGHKTLLRSLTSLGTECRLWSNPGHCAMEGIYVWESADLEGNPKPTTCEYGRSLNLSRLFHCLLSSKRCYETLWRRRLWMCSMDYKVWCQFIHSFARCPLDTALCWGFPDGAAVKNLPDNAGEEVQSPGREDPLEKELAIHSSILAWETPWGEEPGRLQSRRTQRVEHNLATKWQKQVLCVRQGII